MPRPTSCPSSAPSSPLFADTSPLPSASLQQLHSPPSPRTSPAAASSPSSTRAHSPVAPSRARTLTFWFKSSSDAVKKSTSQTAKNSMRSISQVAKQTVSKASKRLRTPDSSSDEGAPARKRPTGFSKAALHEHNVRQQLKDGSYIPNPTRLAKWKTHIFDNDPAATAFDDGMSWYHSACQHLIEPTSRPLQMKRPCDTSRAACR